MVTHNIRRTREAVQYLVDTSYFQHHLKKLRNTLKKPRSMPFRGELEVLNELLIVGRQSPAAFENLIKLAEFKRDDGRSSYQREYMANKRQRDRKVIQLEEMLTGKKLTLDQRLAVLRKQYLIWNKQRDALLKRNSDLSWLQRNEILKEFWASKEAEIEELKLAAAKPRPTKKRVVSTKPIDKRR
jgi:hypothetical protein